MDSGFLCSAANPDDHPTSEKNTVRSSCLADEILRCFRDAQLSTKCLRFFSIYSNENNCSCLRRQGI